MPNDEKQNEWKAPYLPYGTLVNFIDKKLGSNPLPPRIDRGFLDNYAGSVQYMLLGAMQTMGLIGEQGEVRSLAEAAISPDHRKSVFNAWARAFYAEQISLAHGNATAQMLHESFAKHGLAGSTLRKAVVFYLSLVDELELPKSPHFKAPKQGLTGPKKRTQTIGRSLRDAARDDEVEPPKKPQGERTVIVLGDAGVVTVEVDVRWLALPDEKFIALRKAIRDLESLGTAGQEPGVTPEDDEPDDLDEGFES